MNIIRVTSEHADFKGLTRKLDADLRNRYGPQPTHEQHNIIDHVHTAMIGYSDEIPVACGCFKVIDSTTVEVKRMYVDPVYRRHGYSSMILSALEGWSSELGYRQVILETGKGQPEALGLYTKCGYTRIDNYGPYAGLENSVCLKKTL